jgi:general secretion pathway protein D
MTPTANARLVAAALAAVLFVDCLSASRGLAQTTQPAIAMNFPSSVEVKALVDYISARTGINIVYDDELLKKAGTVAIRSPNKMSADQLPAFLTEVLRMKGLELTVDPQTGWTRIVSVGAGGAGVPAIVDHVTLKYADVARLAPQIKQLVTAAQSNSAGGRPSGFDVTYDGRTSQIIAIGPADAVHQAMAVAALLDVAVPAEDSPIRFYKLTNATAADVLDTIRGLEGKSPVIRPQPVTSPRDISSSPTNNGLNPGTSAFGGQQQQQQQQFGGQRTNGATAPANGEAAGNGGTVTFQPPPIGETIQPTAGGGSGGDTSKLGYESVTADTNTNTIIVRGSAEVQKTYEQLIKTLDQRRPQVLLEATVVTLDTTHNFTFGVEFSAHSNGATKILTFSQFGLSTVDATTGALSIVPNTGLNTAVIGSGVANAVIQALTTDTHARVQSAPRILVNDNATGLLTSISEQPFTSVNASTTVATTSFGGYADAGTTITLTPHISEGDYLQLEYSVELSSFTGQANPTTGSPPPRQTDRVDSKVTIPDGATIIVGGLNRNQLTTTVNAIPIIGQIPVLGWLFSDRNNVTETSTLFVFLRPTILRDEEFADLRNISEDDLKDAGMPGNFPSSSPQVMR